MGHLWLLVAGRLLASCLVDPIYRPKMGTQNIPDMKWPFQHIQRWFSEADFLWFLDPLTHSPKELPSPCPSLDWDLCPLEESPPYLHLGTPAASTHQVWNSRGIASYQVNNRYINHWHIMTHLSIYYLVSFQKVWNPRCNVRCLAGTLPAGDGETINGQASRLQEIWDTWA